MSSPAPAGHPETTRTDTAMSPAADSSTGNLLKDLVLIGGGALLVTASVIQLMMWSQNYRDIQPLGRIMLLFGIVGILVALTVVRFGYLPLVVTAALYLALSTGMLILAARFELLGYQEGLPAPYTLRSASIPIGGLLLLLAAALLMSPPTSRQRPRRNSGRPDDQAQVAEAAEGEAMEPATLSPEPEGGTVERIRWPAERPRMTLVNEPVPEPAPPAPENPPEAKTAPEPYQIAEEPAPEPAAAAVEEQAESSEEMLEAEAEPVEPLPEAEAEYLEPLPEVEESTLELAAPNLQPVPESIQEPLRGVLVREQEILDTMMRVMGPDDPRILTRRSNIADYYLSAGEVVRAAELQEGIAADSARILGENHPHTLTAKTKLAQWRKFAKKARRRAKVG